MKKVGYPAFTLIEILVVVVLMGILATIMAPDYLRFKQRIDLKNSLSLLQTDFYEAYSLARSRSRHYEVRGLQNSNFYQLWECTDFDLTDDGLYNCSDSVEVSGPDGEISRNLVGNTELASADFRVRFLAPHGDMQIISPADNPLNITLDNEGLESNLHLYEASGLITTDTP